MLIPFPRDPILLDLGILYYVYMSMLCVFCTNAINILAGVNGVEVGQSLVIACSMVINSFYQIYTTKWENTRDAHLMSIYFLLPFVGVSLGYLKHNWYPAKVFGGDTYAYFAGMTFAVVAIQGHFSKTVLLFMTPQILNFLYSIPQLFHLVDCPRHRMPMYFLLLNLNLTCINRFNRKLGKLEPSYAKLENVSKLGVIILKVFELIGLVNLKRNGNKIAASSNLTLINLVLIKSSKKTLSEVELCKRILYIQIFCSLVGFLIRYGYPKLTF